MDELGDPTPGPWTLEVDGDADEHNVYGPWPYRIHGVNQKLVADFTGGSDVKMIDGLIMTSSKRMFDLLKILDRKVPHNYMCFGGDKCDCYRKEIAAILCEVEP